MGIRKCGAMGAVVACIALAGCSDQTVASSNSSSDPCDQAPVFSGHETVDQYKAACPSWQKNASPPSYPRTPLAAAKAVQSGRGILGSTDAEWSQVHTPDPNVPASNFEQGVGAAYDPSPGSYPDNADRFDSVNSSNGRVDGLVESLPAGTDVDRAVRMAMQMLPKDAHHGRVVVLDVCAAMPISSNTLQSELGSRIGVVYFTSGTASDHYDPQDVGDLQIQSGQTVPSGNC